MFNVLFLCTGNSKRSIMAEALLNHWGKGRFKAYSAGSHPKDKVDENALHVIKHAKLAVPDDIKPKSWTEFEKEGAPHMDFVITVCDNARGETCPIWPGHPITAHWGVQDPKVVGDDIQQFHDVLRILNTRIQLFTQLPLDKLQHQKLKQELETIAQH